MPPRRHDRAVHDPDIRTRWTIILTTAAIIAAVQFDLFAAADAAWDAFRGTTPATADRTEWTVLERRRPVLTMLVRWAETALDT